jgi:formylglycine-generating enzyme required for sulfatase activity
MDKGIILQGRISNNSSLVRVYNGGTFTMAGGEISGNTTYTGGGVDNSGTFTMTGGEISGNTAYSYGGGVYVRNSGTFTMAGGEISGNTASSSGGGVGNSGTFTMTGGEISGNTASSSGGGVDNSGTFTKNNGGTIYGYIAGDNKSNVVKDSGWVLSYNGHAVRVDSFNRRETTAGPDVNLDSALNGVPGGWEYDIGIGMVQINPGTFTRNGYTITLTSGFYMGKYEVTQKQYQAVMANNPSDFSSNPASGEVQGRRPVEQVSWYDAIVFCNKLSMAEGLTPAYRINNSTDTSVWGEVPTSWNETWDAVQVVAGSTGYRLPTVAQWEYACRAGTTTTWSFGDNQSSLTNYAWYNANSNNMTHEVGKKLPNAWGLYDMHGNVLEWCWDWLGSLPNAAQTDPTGAVSGSYRLLSGGSWNSSAGHAASAYRNYVYPINRYNSYGFRLLRP